MHSLAKYLVIILNLENRRFHISLMSIFDVTLGTMVLSYVLGFCLFACYEDPFSKMVDDFLE